MKKINCTIILFLYCFLSQAASVYAMERQICKSPNQILIEKLLDMHLELHIPMSLIKEATIISYPGYIYGKYETPDIPQEYHVCNRSFTQKITLMKRINATNIKPLYNIPLNGCNNNDIDDAYFSEWINQ